MFAFLQPFICPSMSAVKFAIKVSLASAVALFIAFVFDLDQPQWAAATAVIVTQPHSGMVASKGLARIVGTVGGTLLALVLTSLFSQAPWLFILVLAFVSMFCTAASTTIRSVWSYSFGLAGYTTAIIVLPELYKPLFVFDYAVARCTEICLGIICASFISTVLWPRQVHKELVAEAFNIWKAGLSSARSALLGDPINGELLAGLSKIVAVDVQREHAVFEGEDGRNRAKAILSMSRDILSLLRATRGVARQWKSLSEESKEYLQPWLDECLEALSNPAYRPLKNLAKRIYEARRSNKNLEQQDILVRLRYVIEYGMQAGVALSAVRSGKLKKKMQVSGSLSMHRNYSLGFFFGLRAGLAFLMLSALWMLFGWTLSEAAGALMMAAITCSIFANKENAAQISVGFLKSTCCVMVVAFIVSQLILPTLNGFPLLWLAIGIPLFISSLGIVVPATAASCTVFAINIVILSNPSNHGIQATDIFINQSMSTFFGILAAMLAFNLITINTPYWQGKYLFGATLRDLKKLTHSSLGGAETWFASRMADRLILLARHKKILAHNATERWSDALYAMDLGDELLYLRICLANQKLLSKDLEHYLDELVDALDKEPAVANASLLDQPCQLLSEAITKKDTDSRALLALSAVKQLQLIWQQWCQKQGEYENGTA